jgi:hypothetical protein
MTASYTEETSEYYRLEQGQCLKQADTFTAPGAATYVAGLVLARNTSTQKLVPFVSGGATGLGTPCAILEQSYVASGAGDIACTPIISGDVFLDKVSILAGGSLTAVQRDTLRSYGINTIVSEDVSEV